LNEVGREQVPSVFLQEIPNTLLHQQKTTESESESWQRLSLIGQAETQIQAGDVKEWLRERLKTYVMSVTHLNNYLECPRLWYYRNLLRVPAAKTKPMVFGTAVHNALRDLFGLVNQEKKPDVKYLIKRFDSFVKGQLLTDVEKKDMRQLGKKVLAAYYHEYCGEMTGATLLEYDFNKHGVMVGDLLVTGKIDKVLMADKGREVTVVDYKTGNPDNAGAKSGIGGSYWRQLVFYKLLCDASPRFDYEMVSGEIDFVQPSARTGKFIRKKFEISSTEVSDLQKTIKRVWQEIQELRFLESEVACGECEYCRRV